MKIFALLLASSAALWPQAASSANQRYQTKESREQMAKGLGSPARLDSQKPEAIVSALNLRTGMTVADVGTGAGFMLPFLSKAVSASGQVLSEDIFADFLDHAKARSASEGLSNVTFILGTETDPRLPAGAVDIELLLDVYHHFDYPARMLAALAAALKPDGRMAVVEFYKAKSPAGPGHIRLDRDDVIREIEGSGFRLQSKVDQITATQYLLLFVRN